jgi:FkbM family methyltransferase
MPVDLKQRIARVLVDRTPLRDRSRRKKLVHARRRLFEAAGSARYSRPANDNLDAVLERYLPATGTFVEAGANDGFTMSNTYYLERFKGWRGVLIEAIPDRFEECRRLRSQSRVFNCALVDPGFGSDRVLMSYADACSVVKGLEPPGEAGLLPGQETAYEVEVPARTLTEVLEDAEVGTIDFLSLDLEGFETQALRGLDFARYRPRWILVEVTHGDGRPAIESVLPDEYVAASVPTPFDVLYCHSAVDRR